MDQNIDLTSTALGVEDFQWMRQGRAPIACQQCRDQRVRCDVVIQKGSCTNCAFYGVECQVVTGKRRAKALGTLLTIPASGIYMHQSSGVDGGNNSHDRSATGDGGGGDPDPAPRSSGLPLTEKPDHISDEEFVVLRNKKLFQMPSVELRHRVIQAYLHHVYNHLPIISFQDLIFMADPGRRYSNWFVFTAICAISVGFIRKDQLRELGVSSAKAASQMFFEKAETLYRFQWKGHHKYTTLQGLLLLAFCRREIYREDAWSWTWHAYTTAIQMGLDRKHSKTNLRDLGLRRRLWWTCYSQCSLLNVHATTLPRIRMADTDIPPPTEKDFEPQSPIFCLDLIPALTAAQESSSAFVQRVQLLRIYDECTFRQQMLYSGGNNSNPIPDMLLDLKEIFRSATQTSFGALLDEELDLETKALGSALEPLRDTTKGPQSEKPSNLSSDTVSMFLDMERILYNCASGSDTEMDNVELDGAI
ncbi:hypothetical protein BJX64DRAFT_295243 [Aspergillus heterothallicus]